MVANPACSFLPKRLPDRRILQTSCMHSPKMPIALCPTGASYKREEDGIVLVDQDKCMGCNLCAWACPYGARELDVADGTMKK